MHQKNYIFDMDGVIVDNAEFHKKAWEKFCALHSLTFDYQEFEHYLFGKTNEFTLNHYFKKKLTEAEISTYTLVKEEIYRQAYSPYIQPLKGLLAFLNLLKNNKCKTAVATSAPPENVKFVLQKLHIEHLFDSVVDASMVSNSKPAPDIFLKAAANLKLKPVECIVFEDSFSGIEAAVNAEMEIIALATTHNSNELRSFFNKLKENRSLKNEMKIINSFSDL